MDSLRLAIPDSEWAEADNAPRKVEDVDAPKYTAYLSKIKGKPMLNVQKTVDQKWHIFWVEMKVDNAILHPATNPRHVRHQSIAEVKHFFKHQMEEDNFFGEPLHFRRVYKPAAGL